MDIMELNERQQTNEYGKLFGDAPFSFAKPSMEVLQLKNKL